MYFKHFKHRKCFSVLSQELSRLVSVAVLASKKLEIFRVGGHIQSFCVHLWGWKILLFLKYLLSTLCFRLVLLWN